MVAAVLFLLAVIGPKPESLPSLSGRSGSFTVEQSGHRLTFSGDAWSGTGEIRGDLVRVVWIQHSATATITRSASISETGGR